MRPLVLGLEDELAFRADHPHSLADRHPPQQRGERPALDEADVELVAVCSGDDGRRGHGIRALDDLAVDHDPDRHVLAGLERRRVAVEADPEVGERVGFVLAPHESGVVDGRLRVDKARISGEFGHPADGNP